jgi:hypothetical protein
VNFLGHRVQAKGLSPVCNLRCSFKWLPLKNDFSQKEQAKDLSLSDLICALKIQYAVINQATPILQNKFSGLLKLAL